MESRPVSEPASPPRNWWWIFDPRESLRGAAVCFFLGGGVVFTVLIASLAGRTLHRSLESHLGGSFETLAVQVSDKLDRTIFERYRTLQLAANLAALRDPATAPADRRRVLAALQDTTPDFAWIGFLDTTGRIVAATKSDREGTSAEMRPWFRGAREQPFAGNPHEAPEIAAAGLLAGEGENSARFLDLAVPVTDTDGRFAGVLATQVRWDWAHEVQLSVVPETARRERIGVTVYTGNGEVLLDSGGSGWTRPPDLPAIPDRRKFRGNLIEPTTLGTTYLTGFMRSRGFREYRGLGWITAVRQPVDQAFVPVTELQHSIARWGFVFTGLGMIGAWVFAGRISRRLRSVGTAASRIQSGDILATLPSARGEGEIEQMCGALSRLVEDFRAKLDASRSPTGPNQTAPDKRVG
jgi:HAMP domain-containing protein